MNTFLKGRACVSLYVTKVQCTLEDRIDELLWLECVVSVTKKLKKGVILRDFNFLEALCVWCVKKKPT